MQNFLAKLPAQLESRTGDLTPFRRQINAGAEP